MKPGCIPVRATLDARGEPGLTDAMQHHVMGCVGCSEEVADRARVTAALAHLSSITLPAPAEILPRVLDEIGPWAVPEPESRNHRLVVATAAAVATAATAAAAGTAVLLHFHRGRAA